MTQRASETSLQSFPTEFVLPGPSAPLSRLLDRLEGFLALTVLCLFFSLLFMAMTILVIRLVVETGTVRGYVVAAGIAVAVLAVLVLEYISIRVHYRIFVTAVYPTSVAIAFSRMQGNRLLRVGEGVWWLLHVAILIFLVHWLLGNVSLASLSPGELTFLERLFEFMAKFLGAAGAAYACNALVLCTVACWTGHHRAVVAVWRSRLLLDAVIGVLVAFAATLNLT